MRLGAVSALLALVFTGSCRRVDGLDAARLEMARRDLAIEVAEAIGCPLSLVPLEPPRRPAPVLAGLTPVPEVVDIVWGDPEFFWPAHSYFRSPAPGAAMTWEVIISGSHRRSLKTAELRGVR